MVQSHYEPATMNAPVTTMEAAKIAEPVSLDEAFRRFAPYVAAIGLRLLGRDDEVDDLVGDVFVEAVRGLGQLREPEALKGWLATVTVRLARRRLQLRRLRTLLWDTDERAYEAVADPAASPEDRAFFARMYARLDGVPVDDRVAWTLHHLEGETLEATAALCGCSLATVKRRVRAAHDKLEKGLR